jgi:hypothetical protein
LTALVVAPQQDDLLGAVDLHGHDQQQHLDRKVAPVHVVPQEDVLRGLRVAAHVGFEQFEEVEELAMEVAHDGDGVVDGHEVGLGLWLRECVLKMLVASLTILA